MRIIWIILFTIIVFFSSHTIIKAQTIIYSEDFSDQKTLDNWELLENTAKNKWEVCLDTAAPTKWVIDSEALKMVIDGTSCTTAISPKDLTVENYENIRINFDISLSESVDMDRNFAFLWKDANNWYDIKLYGTGIHLEKVIDGSVVALPNSQTTYPFIKDQTYSFSVHYTQQGLIHIFINDALIIESQDPNFTKEHFSKIAFKIASGGGRSVTLFDNFSVSTDAADENLPISLFKQNDPRWALQEYDHALQWSKESSSIERWGCALTSMVMILHYYGVDTFPNSIPITPATLNERLIEQPDGYIGDGLLNWLAITRLTNIVHTHLNSPKLEFSLNKESPFVVAREEIAKKQPLIFQIPGHFFVSNGTVQDDFSIKDPFYSYSLFSQHQQNLLSVRIFTPSNTDLSYLLFLSEPSQNIVISSKQLEPLSTTTTTEYYSSTKSNHAINSIKQLTYVTKPKTGTYLISTQTEIDTPIILYAYSQTGQVIQKELKANSKYTIHFTKEAGLTDVQQIDWDYFIKSVMEYYENRLIETTIRDYILKIGSHAKEQNSDSQKRYIQLLTTFIKTALPDDTAQSLIELLKRI